MKLEPENANYSTQVEGVFETYGIFSCETREVLQILSKFPDPSSSTFYEEVERLYFDLVFRGECPPEMSPMSSHGNTVHSPNERAKASSTDSIMMSVIKEAANNHVARVIEVLEEVKQVLYGSQEANNQPLPRFLLQLQDLSEVLPDEDPLLLKVSALHTAMNNRLNLGVRLSQAGQEQLSPTLRLWNDWSTLLKLGEESLAVLLHEQDLWHRNAAAVALSALKGDLEPAKNLTQRGPAQVPLDSNFLRLYLALEYSQSNTRVLFGLGSDPEPIPYHEYKDAQGNHLPHRSLVLEGSPELGQVTLVRQMHGFEGATRERVISISHYQELMLRYYAESKPSVVFVEGLSPLEASPVTNEKFEEIRKVFPGSNVPVTLHDEQRVCLVTYGAAQVYGALNPEVSLRGTELCGDALKTYNKLMSLGTPEAKEVAQIQLREIEAINCIVEYLKDQPGARVVLEYGALHPFGLSSLGINPSSLNDVPEIIGIWWPSCLLDNDLESLYADIPTLNPHEQGLILRKLSEIPLEVFHQLEDIETRRLNLHKVTFPVGAFTTPGEVFAALLSHLPQSSELLTYVEAVNEAAQLETGPFRVFKAKPYDLQEMQLWTLTRTEKEFKDSPNVASKSHIIEHAPMTTVEMLEWCDMVPSLLPNILEKLVVPQDAAERVARYPQALFTFISTYVPSSLASTPDVVTAMNTHFENRTGPFLTVRLNETFHENVPSAASHAPRSKFWKELTWDEREQVLRVFHASTVRVVQANVELAVRQFGLSECKASNKVLACVLETALLGGFLADTITSLESLPPTAHSFELVREMQQNCLREKHDSLYQSCSQWLSGLSGANPTL
jgi:hypothetical protein